MWYDKEKLKFALPEITHNDEPFHLTKYIPKKKYNFVLEFFKEHIDLINKFQIVLLYSKKDMGKSFIGYLWAKDYFKKNLGNMVYGRLQDKEKQGAKVELFTIFEKMDMYPYHNKDYGKDYICFQNSIYNLRLINVSSYQALRGAIGDDNNFIWFDELNAFNFPPEFESKFINILSTIGRKNNFKFFGSANNETAINNPVLNALQLKFNWNYNGIQLATREVAGVKILGIQLGYQAFNNKDVSIAERIAKNNEHVYNTYYLGLYNTNNENKIINLKEDYNIKKTLFYFALDENIFSFNVGDINELENEIIKKDVILVKSEPFDIKSKHFNNKIKMIAGNTKSDMLFKKATYLNGEELGKFLKPFIEKLKNEKLFFLDFLSNDTFFDLFECYHPSLQKDGIFIDDKFKEFK